ncbi:hypothetical protein AA0113_g1645 [Alternaria arborescens]|uniref:Uncharacterized protein n=1 Tax=Alternaria arborescens TaxID=156630 RepID=A0A4Q4SNT2_9PLEO|nr:hypothetical protein AA0113_g1645 [Alternaria arborescens]
MHGRTFLLFASLILPIVATPVPSFEVSPKDETIEQRAGNTVLGYPVKTPKREPVIEALPVEVRSSTSVDTSSEAASVVEVRNTVETRAKQRPGSGYVTNPKRSEDIIEVRAKQRPGSGYVTNPKRSENTVEIRAKQRGGGGWRRSDDSLETRAKQRGGGGWRRWDDNLETRAKQRGGGGW